MSETEFLTGDYILRCEAIVARQNADMAAQCARQELLEAQLRSIASAMSAAINAPLYALIHDIKAMP